MNRTDLLKKYGLSKEDFEDKIDWRQVEKVLKNHRQSGVKNVEALVFDMAIGCQNGYFRLDDAPLFFKKMGYLNEEESDCFELISGIDIYYSKTRRWFKFEVYVNMYWELLDNYTEEEFEEILENIRPGYKLIKVFSEENDHKLELEMVVEKLYEIQGKMDQLDSTNFKKDFFKEELRAEEERIKAIKAFF